MAGTARNPTEAGAVDHFTASVYEWAETRARARNPAVVRPTKLNLKSGVGMLRIRKTAAPFAVLLMFAACNDGSGPEIGPPASVTIVSGNGQNGTVGAALAAPVVVAVKDANGRAVANTAVGFSIASGGGSVTATANTDADGQAQAIWTLGRNTVGQQTLTAQVGTFTAAFTATAAAGSAVGIAGVGGDAQAAAANVTLPNDLMAMVTDEYGNPVAGASVSWAVTAGGGTITPATGVTNAAGVHSARWTLGAAGAQTANASLNATTRVTYSATIAAVPTVAAITPAILVPGQTAIITGASLASAGTTPVVEVNGVQSIVESATATEVRIRLLSPGAYPCVASGGTVPVSVNVGGLSGVKTHPFKGAERRNLAVGEALTLQPTDARCNELAGNGGRYLLSVTNIGAAPATGSVGSVGSALRIHGSAGASLTTAPQPAVAQVSATMRSVVPARDPLLEEHRKHREAHGELLARSQELMDRLAPARAAMMASGAGAANLRTQSMSSAQAVPNVGDILTLNIPDIKGPNLCANPKVVSGRVVYVGTRGIVVEDVAAPLANTMDDKWRTIGQEFDQQQYAVLEQYFGNPVALDGTLDNNQRIIMLFSKVVNDFQNIAGFVYSGDMFSQSLCPASNVAEIFYGVVPDKAGDGYESGTPNRWLHTIRSTVIHEAKHILANGERLSRGGGTEQRWLEEGSAMLSEELWARTKYGYGWKGNTEYDASLRCELVSSSGPRANCGGKPYVMYDHFSFLYQYYSGVENLTAFSSEAGNSYYGSAWLFLRYLIDQYAGSDEAAFTKGITQTTLKGIPNLEARTGKSFATLLADFSLAMALDDAPGSGGLNARYQIPTWNTRNIFTRMNGESWSGSNPFPSAFPLAVRNAQYGEFIADVASLRPGSSATVDLSGSQSAVQVLELTTNGGLPAAGLQLTIVRVQ